MRVPDINEIPEHPNLTTVADFLKQGASVVGIQTKNTCKVYVEYGKWLNYGYLLFEQEKFGGKISCTWNEWLLSIGITYTTSYIRKLRTVAEILDGYYRFRQLNLPFSEIYKLRSQIANMMELHDDIRDYWIGTETV